MHTSSLSLSRRMIDTKMLVQLITEDGPLGSTLEIISSWADEQVGGPAINVAEGFSEEGACHNVS